MSAAALSLAAPAKLNLALHCGARGADGYTELATWAVFLEAGDTLHADHSDRLTLHRRGRFADALAGETDDLVLRAARALDAAAGGRGRGAALTLTKALPVASGLGGGSSDAAACLRLLDRLWGLDLGEDPLMDIAGRLGADVPMCLAGTPCRAEGRGERLSPAPMLPACGIVLVNPGVPVATAQVFARLERRSGAALPVLPPRFGSLHDACAVLAETRNDLEAPAQTIAPLIGDALAALAAHPACRIARMSGSGATCFALTETREDADALAAALGSAHPGWWCVATAPRSGRPAIVQ